VEETQVLVAAGADAVIGYVCQAVLEPGDEVVVPWPSFPSFVRDAQKRDAVPVTVPLSDSAVDLAALREAVTPRTRLLFVATPNNPTGLAIPRDELIEFVRDLPAHVLPVLDEAYFDYLDPADRLDSIDDLVLDGADVLVLRTFSKLYGLAGLRVGYGVGPAAVVAAMRKVQRGYDVGAVAQAAALASLDDAAEVERRRSANREAIRALTDLLRARDLEPLAGSVANFVLVELGTDADELAGALLRHGVAVQSGTPFGAPTSLRIGVGRPEGLSLLDTALADVLGR
jgi:histidinol-phosphate aminotransferase